MTPYYFEKLNQGLHYQDIVIEELYKIGLPIISYASKQFQNNIGENKAGLEIKNDCNFRRTGNLYIEIAEKTMANNIKFIPSGIYRNDNTWLYLIGDSSKIFVLSKKQLQYYHSTKKFIEKEIPTSRGFLIPVSFAEKFLALKIIDIQKITNYTR